jgi:hypothetical protein
MEGKMSKSESVGTFTGTELFNQKIKEVLSTEDNRRLVGELAYSHFNKYGGCTQSIMQAFTDVLGLRNDPCFQALGGLHGGGKCGLTCGALNAGFMLFSLSLGREKIDAIETDEDKKLMMQSCHKLAQWFKGEYKSTVCSEITGYDWLNLTEVVTQHPAPTEKDRKENCARLTSGTAYKISEILNEISILRR